MSKEKIIKLLGSEKKTEVDIARKLQKMLKKNPMLLDENYSVNRNLFHLLVINNLQIALKKLLKNSDYHRKAVQADNDGKTILHYAAMKDESHSTLLRIILDSFPKLQQCYERDLKHLASHHDLLINVTDNEGNTALHYAVKKNNISAIYALTIIEGIKKNIPNKEAKSVLELGLESSNESTKNALMTVNITKIEPLNLAKRTASSELHDSVKHMFPLLSRSSEHSAYSSSSNSPTSSPAISPPTSPNFKASSTINLKFKRSSTYSSASSLFNPTSSSPSISLVFTTPSKSSYSSSYTSLSNSSPRSDSSSSRIVHISHSRPYKELLAMVFQRGSDTEEQLDNDSILQDFISASKHHSLKELEDERLKTIQPSSENKEILIDLINLIKISIDNKHEGLNLQIQTLSVNFEQLLRKQPPSLSARASAIFEPKDDDPVSNYLWKLSMLKIGDKNNFIENRQMITSCLLGMLAEKSSVEIIQKIIDLFQYFDTEQGLQANYMIWQLLVHCSRITEEMTLPLDKLRDANSKLMTGEMDVGNEINDKFNQLCWLFQQYHSTLFENYHFLREWLESLFFSPTMISFDKLINDAIEQNTIERIIDVSLICSEMKNITKVFYQKVPLEDFSNGNWIKDEKKGLAPTILEHRNYFNSLNNYFMKKILGQIDPEKFRSCFEILIELTVQLCALESADYPDFTSAMLTSSVLNNICIDRLTDIKSSLSEINLKKLKQINQLLDAKHNFKWMKKVFLGYDKTLPNVVGILGELTLVKEGNDEFQDRVSTYGVIIEKILAVKLSLINELPIMKSDLRELTRLHEIVDDDELYDASKRLRPLKGDVIVFYSIASVTETLSKLDSYLSKNLLPCIEFSSHLHSPKDAITPFLAWYKEVNLKGKTFSHQDHKIVKKYLDRIINVLPYYNIRINKYYLLSALEKCVSQNKPAEDPSGEPVIKTYSM